MTITGDPLSGVDEVAWHQLHHAYGPADDVADQLRALRHPDIEVRAGARSTLFGNIYHQGTRWQASAAVVPFLVAIVNDATSPDRGCVLELLMAVVIGDRRDDALPFDADAEFAARLAINDSIMTQLIQSLYHEEDPLDDDEVIALSEAAVARWAFDAYKAASDHLHTVAGWVDDADAQVAARAAAMLVWFPLEHRSVSSLLSASAQHADTTVRASANLALAHLTNSDGRVDDQLQRLLCEPDDLVAVTAGIALAYRTGSGISDEGLAVLVEAAGIDLPVGVTGWDRALHGFIALALQRLGLA